MNQIADCFYCEKSEKLYENRIFVAELQVSTLYLVKDQGYRGRCIVAYHRHVDELFELPKEEQSDFFEDISVVGRVLKTVFSYDKLNYAIYGDTVSHLHMHLVPKYRDTPEWGSQFRLDHPAVYLTEQEYQTRIAAVLDALKNTGYDYNVEENR